MMRGGYREWCPYVDDNPSAVFFADDSYVYSYLRIRHIYEEMGLHLGYSGTSMIHGETLWTCQ